MHKSPKHPTMTVWYASEMLFIRFIALFIWSSSEICKPAAVITGVHAPWISGGSIPAKWESNHPAPCKTKFKSDVNCLQSSTDLCIQLSQGKPNGKTYFDSGNFIWNSQLLFSNLIVTPLSFLSCLHHMISIEIISRKL